MKKANYLSIVILSISITYGSSFKNYSDTLSGSQAITLPQNEVDESSSGISRSSNDLVTLAKLEGYFIEESQYGGNNHLKLKLVFSEESDFESAILSEKNPKSNLWMVDFYNAHLGGGITDKIEEKPIVNSVFEEISVNLNQGVTGLKPDIRRVLRLKISTNRVVNCTINRDATNKVIVDFNWNAPDGLDKMEKESSWISKLSFWK